MLFDTHAHYYDRAFDADREELLSSLPEQGVDLVLCPGDALDTSRACVELAQRHSHVYAAVGVHPENALDTPPDWLAALKELSRQPKVCAIGEIGLDYHWKDIAPKEVQKEVFAQQMALAEELDLPVIVHDREAHRDSLDMVRAFPGVRGVFHCYSGGVEDAKTLVMMGWMLSFTGVVTFKNARRALEVIDYLPMERIMIETDAPYLAPEPWRGRRNHSGYVRRVAETIAQVKGLSTDEVARITRENGMRFFGITEG